MPSGDLDRVVLLVPDIEAAKDELKRVFDIDLRVFYIDSLKAYVGFCDEKLELVQPVDPDAVALKKAQGPLVSKIAQPSGMEAWPLPLLWNLRPFSTDVTRACTCSSSEVTASIMARFGSSGAGDMTSSMRS